MQLKHSHSRILFYVIRQMIIIENESMDAQVTDIIRVAKPVTVEDVTS